VAIDPACDVRDCPGEALYALVAAQLRVDIDAPDAALDAGVQAARRGAAQHFGAMNLN
jgi:hypothetical protein